jgi:hypothetical protein
MKIKVPSPIEVKGLIELLSNRLSIKKEKMEVSVKEAYLN